MPTCHGTADDPHEPVEMDATEPVTGTVNLTCPTCDVTIEAGNELAVEGAPDR